MGWVPPSRANRAASILTIESVAWTGQWGNDANGHVRNAVLKTAEDHTPFDAACKLIDDRKDKDGGAPD